MKFENLKSFEVQLNDEICNSIDANIIEALLNPRKTSNLTNPEYIKKQNFLNTKIKNCPTCGNKVKPMINNVNDGKCNMDCPEIACYYCGASAGTFWPGEFEKALNAWNLVTKNESFKVK